MVSLNFCCLLPFGATMLIWINSAIKVASEISEVSEVIDAAKAQQTY